MVYKNPYRYRGYRYDSETGLILSHNVFAYAMNNPANMADLNGYWPRWLTNAASAVHSYVESSYNHVVNFVVESKDYVSKKVAEVKIAGRKVLLGALNVAVGFSGSITGQTLSSYEDSVIGKKIVSAAERNAANVWHVNPLGTLAISKFPRESELLAFGKQLTNKGVGVTATAFLGLNAWDDFYYHGLRVGTERFLIDVLGAGVSAGIGILAAPIPGGIILGAGAGMVLTKYIFDPWKNSIN